MMLTDLDTTAFGPEFNQAMNDMKKENTMSDKKNELLNGVASMIPAELLDQMDRDAGVGVSTDKQDLMVPWLYLLQPTSGACNKLTPNYVLNAKPGHFWLKNSPDPIRDGTTGIDVIPVDIRRRFTERSMPDRRFVCDHIERPDDVRMIDDNSNKRWPQMFRKNGNLIEEVRLFFGLFDGYQYVFACNGTKNKFAKEWNTFLVQLKHPRTGKILPAYAFKYKLTSMLVPDTWHTTSFVERPLDQYLSRNTPGQGHSPTCSPTSLLVSITPNRRPFK
jgi:hypothetical protein